MRYRSTLLVLVIIYSFAFCNNNQAISPAISTARNDSANESSGLTLPAGFSASVFCDNIGKARHLAVNRDGDVYVKLNSLKNGKGIYCLTDNNNDGKADIIKGFSNIAGT